MGQDQCFDIQPEFLLSDEQFERFMVTLDRDVQDKPRLRRLFAEPSVLKIESQDWPYARIR